ncbi:Ig-like domain-containing protein [Stenotrophomonas sp. C3(2023)]|uniref:RHS repeat-associated core and ParB-like nuclease domain-containing protein n=1 Tax=Stenotrophomonas sp. C3(2023) TaxID=3080277 RepID=UPI00293C565D|nr:Ig-like domain-containing protein [Stenotrophomonas sp. C3(2023)]MDV3468126.1 Ig-like domain-containing protein [Stenotrophomonas sp. C3(2023)]
MILRIMALLALLAVSSSVYGQRQRGASIKLTSVTSTDLVAPANVALKIELLDDIVNGVHESVELNSLAVYRNGELQAFEANWDQPSPQSFSASDVPAGVYDYRVNGTGVSYDAMGNESYRELVSATIRVVVSAATGHLQALPPQCAIAWGASSCTTTLSWSSNAAGAYLVQADAAGSGGTVIAHGASGSVTAAVTAAGSRFSLVAGPQVLANINVTGIPTQNAAPHASITAPAANSTWMAGTVVALQAAASDADDGVAQVRFYVDEVLVGQRNAPPWDLGWAASPGHHTVRAVAVDTRGAEASSAGIPFAVAAPPVVTLTSPVDGGVRAAPGTFALSAMTSQPMGVVTRVDYLANGNVVATSHTAPFAATATDLAAGSYVFQARATDNHGFTGTSAGATVTVIASTGGTGGPGGQTLTRHYVYDANQRLCKVVEPETGATVMSYDGAGNLIWTAAGLNLPDTTQCNRDVAEASGRVVTRSYDLRGRPLTLRFPNGEGNVDYVYTPDGLLRSATAFNEGGQAPVLTQLQYNTRRQLTSERISQPGWYEWPITYAYDALGNLASETSASGLVLDYAPNALGQPTRVGNFASGVLYAADGTVKQFTYGNGITYTAQKNTRQLISRSTDAGVLDYDTRYDANGNVSDIYDLQQGPHYNRHMTYDGRDRLISAGANYFGGDFWHRFTYDALDNMRSWRLPGVKDHQYWYDARNQLTNIRDAGGGTVVGMAYDPQGNLTTKNGQHYQFDFGNRLRTVRDLQMYRYDAFGRRALSHDPAKGNILYQYAQDGRIVYDVNERKGASTDHIYLGTRLLARRQFSAHNGAMSYSYIHVDALGSPVAVTDAAGQVVERTHYEPYGNPMSSVSDAPGYTGHVMDAETGLSYMQQRYMDPQLGVFLSVDPVTAYESPIGMFNRYRYASGNPYRYTDPDGRCDTSFCEFWGGIGRAVADTGYSIIRNTGPSVYGTVDMSRTRQLNDGPFFGAPASQVGQGGYKFGSALIVAQGARGFGQSAGVLAAKSGTAAEMASVTSVTIQTNPRNLIPTQTKAEISGSQVRRLASDMRRNGYDQSKPVDAIRNERGRLEIQDGHHRTAAAKQAGIVKIPVTVWDQGMK